MPDQQQRTAGDIDDFDESEPMHYTNAATKGTVHEAGLERCWCLDSPAVLQAQLTEARALIERLRNVEIVSLEQEAVAHVDTIESLERERDELRAEVKRLRTDLAKAHEDYAAMKGQYDVCARRLDEVNGILPF